MMGSVIAYKKFSNAFDSIGNHDIIALMSIASCNAESAITTVF
jgi:hypothetical protein